MSIRSFASYSCRAACLDFTPMPADDERFDKCESFWRFVQNSPALERMKKIGVKEKVREESENLVCGEDRGEEEFRPLCLLKLNDISKRGITKTALDLPLPGPGCSSASLTDSFTEPEATAAINAELKSWDRAHACWSIPPSTQYTVQATSMPTP